jgi:protein gp37
MKRYGREPHVVTRTSKATFYAPLRWKKPAFVFVNPWGDFFHPDADAWREDAWGVMRATPRLTYLVLTKRPENISLRLPEDWGRGWPNVWLGVTAETQHWADERIPILLQTPAARRFVSCEPLLGEVILARVLDGIDWVIAGCESGYGRRQSEVNCFRLLRDECLVWGVPFFLKQMDVGGRLVKMPELDGKVWAEKPEPVSTNQRTMPDGDIDYICPVCGWPCDKAYFHACADSRISRSLNLPTETRKAD